MRRIWLAAGVAAALVLLPIPARASTSIRIHQATLGADGSVRLVVALDADASGASIPPGALMVTDGGKQIPGVKVSSRAASNQRLAVALAIDVSGSMAGKAMADAKRAAKTFVSRLDPATLVTIVVFNDRPRLLIAPTTDRGRITSSVDALSANGGTALYDGISLAAKQLEPVPGAHSIVVFSDGGDTASLAKLPNAIGEAVKAGASIDVVELQTPDTDAPALAQLAQATHGLVVPVSGSAGLTQAFTKVATDLSNQIVLTYSGSSLDKNLQIAVSINGATDSIVIANPRTGPAAKPASLRPQAPVAPPFAIFAGPAGLLIGIAAAFALFALLAGVFVLRTTRTAGGRSLQRGLQALSARERANAEPAGSSEISAPVARLGRLAAALVRHVPRAQTYEQKLQKRIERADWPMRATEFMVIQAIASFSAFLAGWGISGRWYVGAVASIAAAAAPAAVLSSRIAKRQAAFLVQLPETLQLLAASLQAGCAFLQGVDTLVKECAEPARSEFSRVLTESRLGIPFEDALFAMADRLGSEDFRWVVVAISIQHQSRGNLAELLKTVSQTLRERQGVRRQIKTLSAEGRLSAVILGVMPFVIGGYLMLVNKGYVQKLWISSSGRYMLFGALVLMGAGVLWLRKIIKIDV